RNSGRTVFKKVHKTKIRPTNLQGHSPECFEILFPNQRTNSRSGSKLPWSRFAAPTPHHARACVAQAPFPGPHRGNCADSILARRRALASPPCGGALELLCRFL